MRKIKSFKVFNEAWDSFDIQREEIKSIVGDMLIELDFQVGS